MVGEGVKMRLTDERVGWREGEERGGGRESGRKRSIIIRVKGEKEGREGEGHLGKARE